MLNLPISSTTGAFAIDQGGYFLVESENQILTFDQAGIEKGREPSGVPEGTELTGIRVRQSGVKELTCRIPYEIPPEIDTPTFKVDGKAWRKWSTRPSSWVGGGTVWTPAGISAGFGGYVNRGPERRCSWGPALVTITDNPLLGFPVRGRAYERPEGAEGEGWVAGFKNRWTALDTITGCVYFKKQLWFVVHLGMGYCRYEPGGLVADRMEHWLLKLDWGSWKPTWKPLDFEARNIAVYQGRVWFLEAYWDAEGLKYRVRDQ